MYCSNDGKHPGEAKSPAMSQFHDIYSDRDPDLHYWEARHGPTQNTTPVSTVLHSPEPSTADHEPKIRFQQRHQIQVGRSPVGSGGHNGSSDSTTASSPVLLPCHHPGHGTVGSQLYTTHSILSDGEIVVFDDIEPNWPGAAHGTADIVMGRPTPGKDSNVDGCSKIQTIIGGLTIAEYEGSPRRFGCAYGSVPDGAMSAKSGTNLPRPGFPKRVASYEPNEPGRPSEIPGSYDRTHPFPGGESDTLSYDTKYYPGQPAIDCHDHAQPGSGLGKLQNYALSPESDFRSAGGPDFGGGFRYAPNEYAGRKGSSSDVKTDACSKEVLNEPRVEYEDLCNSMPILEDGLSSGHASDSEGNNVPTGDGFGRIGTNYLPKNGCDHDCRATDIQEALNDIKSTLQNTKTLPADLVDRDDECPRYGDASPVWVLRTMDRSVEHEGTSNVPGRDANSVDLDDETDTDLETDRLLGHQQNVGELSYVESHNSAEGGAGVPKPKSPLDKLKRYHTAIRADSETYVPSDITLENLPEIESKGRHKTREGLLDPAVLIEGVLFRARYLGSTQLVCEGQPTKSTRMMQAEEAVSRIKAPAGESQPSTEVDLFISTEKIMVLNTDLKEIMMDHALRTISYIADIGDLVVLMARRRFVPQDVDSTDSSGGAGNGSNAHGHGVNQGTGTGTGTGTPSQKIGGGGGGGLKGNRTPKMICHVFESEEAQFIAQSIGQAFQVAYMEFLKANGIEDHSFMKEMDYQEVLNSQEIFGDELEIFAKKELQKEVVVPKAKGEILGVVIVESGWGSMLPTVVIANLASSGAAARCGQLNIGDQIIAINGLSLVGLPLSTCQGYIKNTKNQTVVKFTVVPCAPVVEVKIKRPNTKYQLGFSVQNGVICSLLRGGIAERGGVRVGHRIIEINNQSVVAVPHEKIVNLLATSIGEILMKTMPTSMFRLLTGQENPIYI